MTWLNWPNRITLVRIALVPPFVICLLNMNTGWAGSRHLAIVLFGVMALSDALDGFLARRLNQSTPLGRFLDPIADKLLISCAVVLLAVVATSVSGFRLPSWVPVIAIGKDALTVIGFGLVYATTGQYFVEPRPWGKACTLLQLVMVALRPAGAGYARLVALAVARDLVDGQCAGDHRAGRLCSSRHRIRREARDHWMKVETP